MRPNSETARSIIAATSDSLVTSAWNGTTASPASLAVSFSAPLMSAASTLAPSRTNAIVDAFAIPDPAPVITATLPSSRPTPESAACELIGGSSLSLFSVPAGFTRSRQAI